jgi:hypothetical protein
MASLPHVFILLSCESKSFPTFHLERRKYAYFSLYSTRIFQLIEMGNDWPCHKGEQYSAWDREKRERREKHMPTSLFI